MRKGSFGERLRREREMRGVALEEIASATRISTRFLQALENEQWERLPGGIFNRGFVRAVARFLGLDEDSLVAEYALATNDRPEVAVWATKPARPRGRLLPWLAALLLVAIAAGGWFAYRHYASILLTWRGPAPQPPAPRPPAAPAEVGRATREVSSAINPGEPAGVLPEPLVLKIEAGRTTLVTVVADGKTVFDGTMTAGENQRFQALERFEVSARNSSALLLDLNGQTMPPLGPPGEPGSLTLTRNDLKKTPGGQD